MSLKDGIEPGNIVVNADDFGSKSSVNNAIIKLFEDGLLTSTTIMANMIGFDDAIELAHYHKITNKIGVHLVLTEGLPLTKEVKTLSYLFNKNGTTRQLLIKKLFFLNREEKSLIFKEYSKQIEKVKKNGIAINHLDTHQHMHDMWGIMQIITELLKMHNIPSMRILNNLESTAFHKRAYRHFANYYLKSKNLNYTDYFGSRFDFLNALKEKSHLIKNKKVEVMVHPDYNSNGKLIDICSKKEYDFSFLEELKLTNSGFKPIKQI